MKERKQVSALRRIMIKEHDLLWRPQHYKMVRDASRSVAQLETVSNFGEYVREGISGYSNRTIYQAMHGKVL